MGSSMVKITPRGLLVPTHRPRWRRRPGWRRWPRWRWRPRWRRWPRWRTSHTEPVPASPGSAHKLPGASIPDPGATVPAPTPNVVEDPKPAPYAIIPAPGAAEDSKPAPDAEDPARPVGFPAAAPAPASGAAAKVGPQAEAQPPGLHHHHLPWHHQEFSDTVLGRHAHHPHFVRRLHTPSQQRGRHLQRPVVLQNGEAGRQAGRQ